MWQDLKDALQRTTAEVVGFSSRKNKDWFDENDAEIRQQIKDKHCCHQKVLSNPDNQAAKSNFRQACRRNSARYRMTGGWRLPKEHSATQSLLRGTTCSVRPFTPNASPAPLSRWVDTPDRQESHFEPLSKAQLNPVWRRSVSRRCLHRQHTAAASETYTLEEVQTAVKKMKVHKAPGTDDLPAAVHKHGGDQHLEKLTSIFTLCWKKGVVPGDLRDTVIVSLYKNIGEKSRTRENKGEKSNYRSVTLLPIAGKILARVLLDRLIPGVAEMVLPKSQCEIRANRGTTDVIFVLRQFQERC